MSYSPLHPIADGKLTPESLTPVPRFNWVFLIELIVSGVLTLFFLFYFNRLFATLVSYAIRAYTWHYYRVYIDIHALQISLLAGRIFFKGIRYHGENETIHVQTGYLTWRFWSRPELPVDTCHVKSKPKPPECEAAAAGASGEGENGGNHAANGKETPARIEITLNGLEWFVYNRSPAYDSILAGFGLVPPPDGASASSVADNGENAQHEHSGPKEENVDEVAASSPSDPLTPSSRKEINSQKRRTSSSTRDSSIPQHREMSTGPRIFSFFPISMNCYKGALALGNENTKTILTLTFDKAVGKIDAERSGPLDIYKQIFEYDLSHPVIHMKPNPDYRQSQLAAVHEMETPEEEESRNRGYVHSLHRRYRDHRHRVWASVRDLIPYFQRSVESFHPRHDERDRPVSRAVHQDGWLGLTRYLDEEEQDDYEGWNSIEYGRFSTLLDSPSMYFRYYWDIGGPVAISSAKPDSPDRLTPHNINGAEAPEWGMDLTIRGGLLNYGPWADRERINLQSVFVPNSYRDSHITPMLKPGETRQSAAFVLNILIEETTILRIPTREASKDWQWRGRADRSRGASRMKKKDKDRSRGNEADNPGTQGPDIRPFGWLSLRAGPGSTIVYSMAMFASRHGYCNKVDIDLRQTKMTTSVNHESTNMELFLLWDHLILLTDLISDWTSGPFQEYYTFVPIKYQLSFAFLDFKLMVNVNDLNIINNPSDFDDNSFLIIEGEILTARVEIPVIHHRASRNIATFDIQGSNGDLKLSTPLWNTQRTFLDDRPVGGLDTLKIDGSYTWHSITSPKVTDVAIINLSGTAPYLYLYGFILKQFLDVNENYFGRTIHFKTFDEHRAAANSTATQGIYGSNPAPHTNGLDVILHIAAEDIKVLLPTGLYDRHESLALKATSLELDVRFTNYYMDFHCSLSPLEVSVLSEKPGTSAVRSGPQLYINGLGIFGHRLFGLPPTEPTYACNWDFQVGSIVGECSPSFIKSAKSAFESLAFSFDDDENALPPIQTGVYDVTFLRANVKSIKVWILAEKCGLKMSLFVDVTVPDIVLAVVDRTTLGKREDFDYYRSLQQNHIRKHDSRTHRTPWLVFKELELASGENLYPSFIPPTMPVPSMPEPIQSPADSKATQEPHHSPLNEVPDATTIPLTSSLNPTPDQYVSQGRRAGHCSTTWAMPRFSFYHVQLDETNVPPIPSNSEVFIGRNQALNAGFGRSYADEFLAGAQACINCSMAPDSLQPRKPLEILDAFQAKVTSAALAAQKSAIKKIKKISSFNIELPSCRVRFFNTMLKSGRAAGPFRDQFDLDISYIRALIREKVSSLDATDFAKPKTSLTAHIVMRSLMATVREENMETHSDVRLCNIDLMSSNESVARIEPVLNRTMKLVESLSATFQRIFEAHEDRLLYLIHYLTKAGVDMPEPHFMTLLSDALRATKPHLRLEDAWKIISRIRNIYKSITPEQRGKLEKECQKSDVSYPEDAKDAILSVFETWRAWELAPIEKNLIIKALWGEAATTDETAGPLKAIDAAIYLGQDASSSAKDGLLVIQNHCSNAYLQLNWELCQLIETILESNDNLGSKATTLQRKETGKSRYGVKPEHAIQYETHVLLIADKGSVWIDGINLEIELVGPSKLSSARVISHSSPLMEWEFHNPNIFLRYELTENPLELIHVADRVVEDEVKQILKMVSSLSDVKSEESPTSASSEEEIHYFHVATFLDDYQIRISLLPSVAYTIEGDVARLSVTPLGRMKFEVDYDIKNNADTTIEVLYLDVSAVQNLLGALNGPEISHFIDDLSHDGKALNSHLEQVLMNGRATQPKEKAKKKGPVYQVRLTLAGINTHASSPGLRTRDHTADMNIEFNVNVQRTSMHDSFSYGKVAFGAQFSGSFKDLPDGKTMQLFHLKSSGLEIDMSAETASLVLDIVAHLQEEPSASGDNSQGTPDFLNATYSVELSNIQISWLVLENTSPGKNRNPSTRHDTGAEDLVFSIRRVELTTKEINAARLRIQQMQLQMVPVTHDKKKRSQNSALLPEAVFNVSFVSVKSKWKLALNAAGKALDLQATSDFIIPASHLQKSMASAVERVREAKSLWTTEFRENPKVGKESLGFKQLDSVFIDTNFDGAIVTLQERRNAGDTWTGDSVSKATLRAPGVALKIRFEGSEADTPILEAEMKVEASSNVLHPSVMPLLTRISSSIRDVVGREEKRDSQVTKAGAEEPSAGKDETDKPAVGSEETEKPPQDKSMDPTTILGSCKLSIGLWIRKQEFTLSCQPIARVEASAGFEDVNITVNTVQSEEQRRFFAVLIAFNKLRASVKHVYSNDPTASFNVDSIVVSMMNSKHAQDFLLFREIWKPPSDHFKRPVQTQEPSPEVQAYMVQRYQQMAATGAFPWNSTLAIDSLDIQLDLGQTIGKAEFSIKNLWLSSKKTSDWEQNLCIGFEAVSIKNEGRLTGFVELSKFRVRTSIEWPGGVISAGHTPLIQAAVGIGKLQADVSFEYLPVIIADVTSFEFFMYNVREDEGKSNDRLVSMLEGDKLHVFCTTITASQVLGLYQTFQRLIGEKRKAFQESLKEVEDALHRTKLSLGVAPQKPVTRPTVKDDKDAMNLPISLQTTVVVKLHTVTVGAFPNTFRDAQIFQIEALGAEARFSVGIQGGKIHTGLGLTLGELRVALSSVGGGSVPADANDLTVDQIVSRATSARGGIILKVPRVLSLMETWQQATSNHIEYRFRSSFEGKVDVGWNYSRIAFIRGMWSTHSRALAARLGKPLPQAAVQITGGPKGEGEEGEYNGQEKITAVLRDMGEATPPLEWIGLQRDRLPNLMHQIIIVTLMEVAKDVEDAYSNILGSS
ncbi:TPA_exp: putative Fermentation associated protein (Csf1) [Trichophyton benhamiae CBS 112371]|nr:TPA_exp: putative Fermentation associated protein (Csf1) [Trichophyton benhamiae CBS 112371]